MTPYENLIPPKVGRGIYGQVFDSPDAAVGGVLVGDASPSHPDGIKVIGAVPILPATEDAWTRINETMQAHFPGDRIVGWYRGAPGLGATLGESDATAHQEWFASREQVLLAIDPRAGEEAVYGWHGNGLVQFRAGPTPLPGLGGEPKARDEDGARLERADAADPGRLRDRGAGAIALALALPVALGVLLGLAVWFLIAPDAGAAALEVAR